MQFEVFRNTRNRAAFPYLLDVQHDLLQGLNTRIVVPLTLQKKSGHPFTRLHPVFTILGERCAMATQHMAAVPVTVLRSPVADLNSRRAEIIGALDMLFTGY